MELWQILFLAVVIIALVWWTRRTPASSDSVHGHSRPGALDPDRYYQRSKQRLERVMQESDRLDRILSKNPPDMRRVSEGAQRLRRMAEEQRAEVVPQGDPDIRETTEQHRQGYFSIMDIQARKAEDIISTGGANLEAIAAEEEELMAAAQQQAFASQERSRKLAEALGTEPPDFRGSARR